MELPRLDSEENLCHPLLLFFFYFETGLTGLKGEKGNPGIGTQGPRGPPGPAGKSFYLTKVIRYKSL